VGPPAAARTAGTQLAEVAPGAFEVRRYESLAAARTAVLHRSVYGAFQLAPSAAVLVASAASPAVAVLLQRGSAAVAQKTGRSIAVQDVVPLPPSDSTGATNFSALLSLILAGLVGTALVYIFTRQRSVLARVVAIVGIAIGSGLVTALVTNFVVGAFPSHFFGVWGVATLFVLALALPVTAFQALFGIAGTALGWILFLVIGNPASGGASAPELLPGFWRALSQSLPDGAAVTSMRDVVYFNGHGSSHALIVLAVYAIVGTAVAMAVERVRGRSEPAEATT
jgi:hypothetical protein